MDTRNKYSTDLWIVSRQLPSLTAILDEGVRRGWSELCYPATYPLQGHASFNTKTEYILALRLNLQAEMKILGVEMHVSQNEFVVFPFTGCDPKATRYYETNSQGRKQ